jgi:mannose-6-phosphate isomerase-like protein (cupin superfamily)
MAKVFTQAGARNLNLPGRTSLEIVSGRIGSHSATLRLVEIPVETGSGPNRAAHLHADFEECIFVVSGSGTTHADSGDYSVNAGDTILIPAGEKHFTRNTGKVPLRLLCFFPVADISRGTTEISLLPTEP